jgi:hypothetical protein
MTAVIIAVNAVTATAILAALAAVTCLGHRLGSGHFEHRVPPARLPRPEHRELDRAA